MNLSGFFSDIKNFFHGGAVLGIDIGTSSLKIAEIKKTGDRFSLVNYEILETKDYLDHPNQAIQTSSLKISPPDASLLLKLALREMKPKSSVAIVSLPAFTSFSTTLDFPDLPEAEIEKAVQFQAPQYIPLPISEVALEWRVVGGYTDSEGKKHSRVLLVAIANDAIKNYREIFRSAGIRLVFMEHEAFALARAISGSITEAPTLVVDIGAISTNAFVVSKGIVQTIGQTDYGGTYMTQAVSRSLEISMSRAEELKRRRGLAGSGVDSELSTILLPFLDVIIQETRRVKDSFEAQSKEKVQKVMLAGGGANLQGIEKYVSERLGLLIQHHSFTSGISMKAEIIPVAKELDNRLAVAFGCARRYFL